MRAHLTVIAPLLGVGLCVGCVGVTPEPESEEAPGLAREEAPEPDEPEMTEAEMLTVIAGAGFRERERTTRRFRFILDAFGEMCPSEEGPASIPDRLVHLHRLLEDAGLGEGLLDMANALHRLTSEVSVMTGGEHGGCTDFWTAYALLRRDQGFTSERAVESVAGIYRALWQ